MATQPFFIWDNKKLLSINPEQVMLLETTGNYTKIVFPGDKCYMVRTSLTKALEKLPAEMFIRIHSAYAVSIFYIEKIERDHLTVGGKGYPIARQYYKKLKEKLNIIE
jgi:DNA-binding LytR/AlgR family response regulator